MPLYIHINCPWGILGLKYEGFEPFSIQHNQQKFQRAKLTNIIFSLQNFWSKSWKYPRFVDLKQWINQSKPILTKSHKSRELIWTRTTSIKHIQLSQEVKQKHIPITLNLIYPLKLSPRKSTISTYISLQLISFFQEVLEKFQLEAYHIHWMWQYLYN